MTSPLPPWQTTPPLHLPPCHHHHSARTSPRRGCPPAPCPPPRHHQSPHNPHHRHRRPPSHRRHACYPLPPPSPPLPSSVHPASPSRTCATNRAYPTCRPSSRRRARRTGPTSAARSTFRSIRRARASGPRSQGRRWRPSRGRRVSALATRHFYAGRHSCSG